MSVREQIAAATGVVYLADRNRHTGSAVLVDRRHVLTAAHVLPRNHNAQVEVSLPLVGQRRYPAVRIGLGPEADEFDVAVLDLGKEFAQAAPVAAAGLSPRTRMPDEVHLFGYPLEEIPPKGVWRNNLRVAGTGAGRRVQLNWQESVGALAGHSGGPVVDGDTGEVVGILVAGSDRGRFDRFVPVTVVGRLWAGLARPWMFAGLDAGGGRPRRSAMGR